jgi:hypothetical protein
MTKRQYLLLHGWLYALVVIILLVFFVFQEIDEIGIIFGTIILIFLSLKSYACFMKVQNIKDEDNNFGAPANSSTDEKITYYKRILFIALPAFIILSVWIFWQLNNLELGLVESVSLWEPISLLYDWGGFWLAVLATPILGILLVIELIFKIKKLRNSDR